MTPTASQNRAPDLPSPRDPWAERRVSHTRRLAWRYAALLLLLAGVVLFQARHFRECARYLLSPAYRVSAPFNIRPISNHVVAIRPNAEAAGLRRGDRVLAVDGIPLRGRSTYSVALSRHKPGEEIVIRVEGPAGNQREVSIRLEGESDRQIGVLSTLALGIFTPLICVLLGFVVAFIRPADSRAWLLLLLMLSFAALAEASPMDVGSWDSVLRPYAVFFQTVCSSTWPIWMVLFGLYFPERLRLDQRFPWVKFLLLAPLILGAVQVTLFTVLSEENWRAGARLAEYFFRLQRLPMTVSVVGASVFFAILIYRVKTEANPDARRRLKLLLWGTAIALTPMFLVVVGFLTFGMFRVIRQLEWTIFLFAAPLPLFPLTLAYVIVVERAMDLRVVIRQSLQYAMAQRGVRALRLLTALTALFLIVRFDALGELSLSRRIQLAALLVGGVFLAMRLLGRLGAWVDQHFFRDAYQAEQVLMQLTENVRTIVEPQSLLETVSGQIADALHLQGVAALVKNNGHFSAAHVIGYPAGAAVAFPENSPVVERLRSAHRAVTLNADDPDSLLHDVGSSPDRERLAALHTQVLLPLSGKNDLLGFLSLGPKKSEEPYTRSDLRLLESVALQTGLSLENGRLSRAIAEEEANKRRYERELEIAREVQQTLFPQVTPPVAGLDYAGHCRPATGVGGDYYDFIALAGGRLGIAIGDVSGKGIPAALLMAGLQAFLRGQKTSGEADLAELMSNVNQHLFQSSASNRYATLFYAEYEPQSRLLRYVNAGHNPPIVLRGDAVMHLTASGPPVGLLPSSSYREGTMLLQPGDLFIGYTDGVSEAMNADEEEWGEPAMIATALECRHLPPAAIIERIIAAADQFSAGAPQNDDMTLVVLHVMEHLDASSLHS